MQNRELAEDHLRRAALRLKAVDVLHAEGARWAVQVIGPVVLGGQAVRGDRSRLFRR